MPADRGGRPTLEALAHRVVMASFPGPVAPPWVRRRLEAGLGSVALFGSNVGSPPQVADLTAALRAAGPDVLVATDEEAGDVTRLHVSTGSPWPGNAALGVVDDVEVTRRVAYAVGGELAAVGIDLDLAPVVDVNSNPANPVIGTRSFGSTAELVARHSAAFTAGLQDAGVGACAKHFPGHGDTSVDSHLGLPTVDAAVEVLHRRELVPFAGAVAAGAVAVMTSHVLLPALDPAAPATLSRPVLSLLREELGFDGLVVSDALDMAGASAGRGVPAAAVAALRAGCDLLCLGAEGTDEDVAGVVAAVVESVGSGELAEERLTDAARRVLRTTTRVRELRAAAPPPGSGSGALSPAEAVAVAARAIEVEGALPATLQGAPTLRFRTGGSIAVGQVPWGPPAAGAAAAAMRPVDVDEVTSVEAVLERVQRDEPLVALVRDAHRHPWVLDRLRAVAAVTSQLVVVEMGWPGPGRLPGAATVRTYGASAASTAALLGWLADHDR